MKKIEAIIRKSKFDETVAALKAVNINFFSYWDVTGSGHEKAGHVYRGIKYNSTEIQRVMLSIVVSDSFVKPAIDAIMKTCSTNTFGDGKIFVLPVENAYNIRNKTTGESALQ